MNSIKKCIANGLLPTEAFRILLNSGECSTLMDIAERMIQEYPDIPTGVLNAIINWNRGGNPQTEGVGLNDARLNELLMSLYGDKLKETGAERGRLS